MTVRLIGIAGGSGAGKSWFATRLAAALSGSIGTLSEDDYYICSTLIPNFDPSTHDFDTPAAKDYSLLRDQLDALRQGYAVNRPVYDFTTHSRTGSQTWGPYDVVIVEGLHTLFDPAVTDLYDLAIWIEVPDDVRYQRRLARDTVERQRTPQSVERQWKTYAAPAYQRYAACQRDRADMTLQLDELTKGDGAAIQRVLEQLRTANRLSSSVPAAF